MMGLPYLASPVWKKGVSRPASMKLPSAKVRNSRIGSPLICPPMMNEALNGIVLRASASPSRRSVSRTASETSVATSNMVRAVQIVVLPAGGSSPRCFSRLITACVPARLPELKSTMERSPSRSNTVVLQNVEMLSTPALVRESDASTMPSGRSTPTQYVMFNYSLEPRRGALPRPAAAALAPADPGEFR